LSQEGNFRGRLKTTKGNRAVDSGCGRRGFLAGKKRSRLRGFQAELSLSRDCNLERGGTGLTGLDGWQSLRYASIGNICGMIRTRLFNTAPVLWLMLLGWALSASAGNSVVAWGAGKIKKPSDNNDYGQSIVPANLTNAVLARGGWRHSLALKADGTLQGWGDDSLGQTDFSPANGFVAISCGDLFSLGLKTNGFVVAAGDDYYGQAEVPSSLTNAVAVECGFYHGLALRSDGTVAAWGGGDPKSVVYYGQAIVPAGLSNVVAIAGGGWHSLVLRADGTVFAWGRGDDGQTAIPVGLIHVVAIGAGAAHNIALTAEGTVVAWGLNTYGQTNVPPGLSNVVAIAAGGWHNLALKRDGTVVAWGAGSGSNPNVDYGQNLVPANLTNVVRIAAGELHSLAVVGSGPPVSQLALPQPSLDAAGFEVSPPTQNGKVYQLQHTDSLTNRVWQSLPLHAGTGGPLPLLDPAPAAPQRFYRVGQW
jgi:hypothetical protein